MEDRKTEVVQDRKNHAERWRRCLAQLEKEKEDGKGEDTNTKESEARTGKDGVGNMRIKGMKG